MQFTLSLSDYIDQYITNISNNSMFCPVCYEEVLELNRTTDMEHLVECYRIQLLDTRLREHFDKHGEFPEITANLILDLVDTVRREMEQYCIMNQI